MASAPKFFCVDVIICGRKLMLRFPPSTSVEIVCNKLRQRFGLRNGYLTCNNIELENSFIVENICDQYLFEGFDGKNRFSNVRTIHSHYI